ncbi:hypothetical protein IG631_05544 [Alternaria alternata]|nr:hypothetical protein IG631_05544 [Alternaria alternata]
MCVAKLHRTSKARKGRAPELSKPAMSDIPHPISGHHALFQFSVASRCTRISYETKMFAA